MDYDYQMAHRRYGRARQLASTLGWFSVGLGLTQLLAPKSLTRPLGIEGTERFTRLCGARELACGMGILRSGNPAPWVEARMAGDAIDMAVLTSALAISPRRGNVLLALGAVAGIAALDYLAAKELGAESRRPRGEQRDYSDRSGLRRPPHDMRGAWRDSARRQRLRIDGGGVEDQTMPPVPERPRAEPSRPPTTHRDWLSRFSWLRARPA